MCDLPELPQVFASTCRNTPRLRALKRARAERMTSVSFPINFFLANPQLERMAILPTGATSRPEPLQAPGNAPDSHLDSPDSVKPYGSTAGARENRTVSPQVPLAFHLDWTIDGWNPEGLLL